MVDWRGTYWRDTLTAIAKSLTDITIILRARHGHMTLLLTKSSIKFIS